MLHMCNGCRKLLAAATPTVVLDVWTNSLAANFTPSVFWDRVFASGALNSIGPRQAQWTGTFLNATTYLVRLCLTCLPLSRGVLTDCDCGRACCRKTRTKPLLGAFKTHRSLAMQGGCPCTFRHHLLSVQTDRRWQVWLRPPESYREQSVHATQGDGWWFWWPVCGRHRWHSARRNRRNSCTDCRQVHVHACDALMGCTP
jgi:hypothetical protein